ncbi:MAG: phage tail length tape measure family protein, partial [Sphingomonas sp.]|nr:phage tail length tape measure family protein [Sphingomonas sp.]
MSDRSLAIKIVFDALDRLSAPLKRMTQTTANLNRTATETARRLGDIKRAQAQLAAYKAAESQLRATATSLDVARRKTAELRAEIGASTNPPLRLANALAKAERSEATLTERHEKQGSALEQLQRKLNAAGIDVAELATHERRLADAAQDTSRALERQQQRLARIERLRERGRRVQAIGGNIAGAGAIASATITAPLGALLGSSIIAARESAQATAQARQAIASMGPAAGRTLQQLQAFAARLQQISLYDDDDILKKVTANMLTFGKIAGRNFDRAQIAAVNLSARLGQDLQPSAIAIGKALNDPIRGITSLRRLGIQFTDSQKDQIKTLVETGKVAQAQTLILDELGREFGGAANAARKADPGGALAVEWRNFQETIGGIALKYLPPLLQQLTQLLTSFNTLDPATQTMIVALAAIAAVAGPVITVIGALVTILGAVAAVLGVGLLAAGGIVLAVIAIIGLLAYAGYQVYQNWAPIKAFFIGLWNGIEARVRAGIAFWQSLGARFAAIGRAMLQGLIIALNPLTLVKHILGLGGTIVTTLKRVLGIKSPSRVFAGIGDQMMAGLSMGLDRGVDGPLDRLWRGS